MQNISSRRARRLGSTLVASGLLALASGFFAPALAASVEPTPYDGDPSAFKCATFAPVGQTWLKYDRDPWTGVDENGLHKDDVNGLEITISNATDKTFDWKSNLDIEAVLVKGGPGGNVYSYPGDNPPDLHDEGLMAPINTKGGDDVYKTYAISHVTFCWTRGDKAPPQENPGPECVDGHLPNGEPCEKTPPQKPDCVDHPQEICDLGTPGGGGDNPGGGGETPGGGGETPGGSGETPGGGGDQPTGGGEQPKDVPTMPEDTGTEVLGERLEQGGTLPRTGVDSSVLAAAGALLVSLGMTTKVASRLAR